MGFFHPCRIRAIRVGYRGCYPQLMGGACFGRIFLKGGGGPVDFRRGGSPADSRCQGRSRGIFGALGAGRVPSGNPVAPVEVLWNFRGVAQRGIRGAVRAPAEKWESGVICFTRAGGRGHRWGVAGRWGSRGRGFMNAPGASLAPGFLYGPAASRAAFP